MRVVPGRIAAPSGGVLRVAPVTIQTLAVVPSLIEPSVVRNSASSAPARVASSLA